MATRFYLPSSGTAPLTSLAVDSGWEQTTSLERFPCYTLKKNTSLTDETGTWASAATQQWARLQYQSQPMVAAYSWTTSDTVSMVIGAWQGENQTDSHLAYTIRVVSEDGSTIRGTIGLYHAASTEYGLTRSTRIHSARTGGASNFSSQIGDRIIIEIGHHGVTPSLTAANLRSGDPSATEDFALTEGLTTDLCPWVELSRTVDFEPRSNKPAYMKGSDAALHNKPAYAKGQDSTSANKTAYANGFEPLAASDNQVVYTSGSVDILNNKPVYTLGSDTSLDNTSGYLTGGIESLDEKPSYTIGQDTTSDNQLAFMSGGETASDFQSAYLSGNSTDLDNIPAYITGQDTVSDNQIAYSHGSTASEHSAEVYTHGSENDLNNKPGYLYGNADISNNKAVYIEGYVSGTEIANNKPGYLKGRTRYSKKIDINSTLLTYGYWQDEDEGAPFPSNLTNLEDTDWIENPYANENFYPSVGDYYEAKFNIDDWILLDGDYILRWRAAKIYGGQTLKVRADLKQSGSIIASNEQTITSSWQIFEYTLSAGEKAAITDHNDLSVRFTITEIS